MITIKAIDHINLNVKNLEETILFYKNLFNFEVKETGVSTSSGSPYAIIGQSQVGFLAIYEDENFSLTNYQALNHFGFYVHNIEDIYNKLKTKGINILYDGFVKWPESRSLYIKDPNGFEIELSEFFGGKL